MNLRAIYHLTVKFSTDYIGILFDRGRMSSSDSRMKSCCADEQGCVTYSLMPDMAHGRMIIFPSYSMH